MDINKDQIGAPLKVVGLITEYNPFHNGHKYHIEQAKKLTGADYAVVIMSGNYVQRGTPSFVDKYTKTTVALNNGADLIIELPYCFACASAEYFSYCAVSILDKLNIIDYICFGAENNDISIRSQIAEILINEPKQYKDALKASLKEGKSFALARSTALKTLLDFDEDIINSPNNILGIEYIKALIKRKSKIKPMAIKRINANYHDSDFDSRFYSATAIRSQENTLTILNEIDLHYKKNFKFSYPITVNDFDSILGASLLQHYNANDFDTIFDLSPDFINKIINNIYSYKDINSFIELLKSKDITYSYISRGLLHILLDIKISDIKEYLANDITDYIRILGFKSSTPLLGAIKKSSDLAILTRLGDANNILSSLPSHNLKLLKNSNHADNIYRMIAMNKYNFDLPNEYTHKQIKID